MHKVPGRWLALSLSQLAGFFAIDLLWYGSLDFVVDGGGMSRLEFVGYIAVSIVTVVAGCFAFGDGSRSRLASTMAIAVAIYACAGVPISWLATALLQEVLAPMHFTVFTVIAWLPATTCTLGAIWLARYIADRVYRSERHAEPVSRAA